MHDLQTQGEPNRFLSRGAPDANTAEHLGLRIATESDAPRIGEILADVDDPISTLAFGPRASATIAALNRIDAGQSGVTTHVAIADGRVVGVAVVVDRARRPVGRGDLRVALGRSRALWAALVVRVAAQASLGQGEAYLESFAVAAEWRRFGVGRALLAAALATSFDRGSVELTFWVAARNAAGLDFFHAAGFESTRERRWILLPGPPWAFRMRRFRVRLDSVPARERRSCALPRGNG